MSAARHANTCETGQQCLENGNPDKCYVLLLLLQNNNNYSNHNMLLKLDNIH